MREEQEVREQKGACVCLVGNDEQDEEAQESEIGYDGSSSNGFIDIMMLSQFCTECYQFGPLLLVYPIRFVFFSFALGFFPDEKNIHTSGMSTTLRMKGKLLS